jgi:hypothetical protein
MAACVYNLEVCENVIVSTLVRLSTDPKLNVTVNIKTQNIITHVT